MSSPFLSSPAISPEAGSAEQARREMENKAAALGNLSGKKLDPETKAKKLREACEGFESVFIQKMWQEMRNTLPKGGMLHGREERFWQDMYDQELAKKMTSAGGIGLADMMFSQLSRNLGAASRETAGAGGGGHFTPAAAPLLQGQGAAPIAQSPAQSAANLIGRPEANDSYDSPPDGGTQTHAPADKQLAAQSSAAPAKDSEMPAAEPEDRPNPVVEQALASLRAQQALREQASQASAKSAAGSRAPLNGIEMAQRAKRDAGDKLGSRAIRPPLHNSPAQRAQAMTEPDADGKSLIVMPSSGTASPLVPGAVEMAAAPENPAPAAQPVAAQAQATQSSEPVVRRIRKTSNIPPKNRIMNNGQQPVRMLNTDGTAHGSRAGAGLAAYHQAQAQTIGAMQPVATAPGQQMRPEAQEPDKSGFNIPPLTPQELNSQG